MLEDFINWDLAPYVMVGLFFLVAWFVDLAEKKYIQRKQANCEHEKCEKTSEITTYDAHLNPTHTVTLKCLSCKKIIEVKK